MGTTHLGASGKAGAIVAAFGVQTLTLKGDPKHMKQALILLSVTNMFGFFFTFLVPETMGRSLEELSVEDGSVAGAAAGHVLPTSSCQSAVSASARVRRPPVAARRRLPPIPMAPPPAAIGASAAAAASMLHLRVTPLESPPAPRWPRCHREPPL